MKENVYRSIFIEDISPKLIKKQLTISGWIQNIRDHGGVLFLDLRDNTGVLQIVSNDDELFKGLSKESVIRVEGTLRLRSEDNINDKIPTGSVELLVSKLELLSSSLHTLPFEIMSSKQVQEDIRLKYRYLDMRNDKVKSNILLRSEILHFLRNKMYDDKFIEVQTPILTASSPEGARDFLVPSRHFKGMFYALPQAPQIYKELLMVGGISKYFQIAPCFRDEDARSDRTLEFYQLDLEMSFVEEKDILEIGSKIFYDTFKKYSNKEVSPLPFKIIPYKEAMEKYGSDKPDLRNPLIIEDISEILKDTTFGPFKSSVVKAIYVKEIGSKSNSWFNEIVDYATSIGMPGIGYLTYLDGEFKGPIDKFLSIEERKKLINKFDMEDNSVVFFIANKKLKTAQKFSGLIRNELANKLSLIDNNKLEICIINDFPMFEYDEKTRKYEFCHNPFSMPQKKEYNKDDMESLIAYQFDFVCNGNEMASGAIRNSSIDSLIKGFEMVGYTKEEVESKFQSLMTAFKYGCPPHGGMALGIDRVIMLINDEKNLREVQAFPTTTSGYDALMGSPSIISNEELKELGIIIKEE